MLFLVFALIGALIGWITNILAIKLIFKPTKPVRLPGTGLVIQGVIPKRQGEIARTIGQVVAEKLVTADDIFEVLTEKENQRQLSRLIINTVRERVSQRLPQLLPGAVKTALNNLVEEILNQELPVMLKKITREAGRKVKDQISIAAIVEDKVASLDLQQLETLIISVSRAELRHIEFLGAVIGFVIGVIQWLLVQYAPYLTGLR